MSQDDDAASARADLPADLRSLPAGDLASEMKADSDSRLPLVVVAWCPDEEPEVSALAYEGQSAREIARQHAEHLFYRQAPADRSECYDVRVRATRGDRVREWDVCVDVEIEASFYASVALRA